MDRTKKKIFNITLEDELKKALKEEAKEKGLSLNAYIRMILFERNK